MIATHDIKFILDELDDGGIEPTTYCMRSDRSTFKLDALFRITHEGHVDIKQYMIDGKVSPSKVTQA